MSGVVKLYFNFCITLMCLTNKIDASFRRKIQLIKFSIFKVLRVMPCLTLLPFVYIILNDFNNEEEYNFSNHDSLVKSTIKVNLNIIFLDFIYF